MSRGPKPKPAAVRDQTRAVHSRRSKAAAEPAPAAYAVDGASPPAWLKGDGLALWNERAPILSQAKLLTAADVGTFARYCRNFALWLKLRDEMDKDGATYETVSKHGTLLRANPSFLIADRLERQLLAVEDRFGLNPSERQRIVAARLSSGYTGELFPRREDDPASKPTEPARPIPGPIGMLQ